ncbi:MAG: hypothetical protein U1E56_11930 [Bauldia sp.]
MASVSQQRSAKGRGELVGVCLAVMLLAAAGIAAFSAGPAISSGQAADLDHRATGSVPPSGYGIDEIAARRNAAR